MAVRVGDGVKEASQSALLMRVAEASKVLEGCVDARTLLGAAKAKILRAREKDHRDSPLAPLATATATFNTAGEGGSNGGIGFNGGNCGNGDGSGHGNDNDGDGHGEEEIASMRVAVPLARDFADKMAELAEVGPGLSRLLVGLTEVYICVCYSSFFPLFARFSCGLIVTHFFFFCIFSATLLLLLFFFCDFFFFFF